MLVDTPVFLLGLTLGLLLLLIGAVAGYWLGRIAASRTDATPGKQLLTFLKSMSQWTTEFSVDVLNVQKQLAEISERVRSGDSPREELLKIVSTMMMTNRQLQERLHSTEKKLELQTHQLISYTDEARRDALTGLSNRRAFDKSLEELVHRWYQQQKGFCVAMIDVDHFKQINDRYGHPAGDLVLKQVARLIQDEFSNTEVVARYGGEEFCILTPSDLDQATQEVDRVRDLATKLLVGVDGGTIRISFSGGVARILPEEDSAMLVRRADEALYAAKTGGRNRVYWHDGQRCHLVSGSAAEPGAPAIPELARSPSTDSIGSTDSQQLTLAQARLRRIVEEETQRIAQR